MSKHEVDVWDARRLELKREYIAAGETEEVADDMATNQVRREIRGSPASTEARKP